MNSSLLESPLLHSPEAVIAEAARIFLPPPDLTVSEWADAKRKLGSKTNAEPGDWHTSRNPMLKEIMDCCSNPMVREVTFVKPRQIGGTASLVENVVGYYMDQDPAQIGVFFETDEKAQAWSKERLMAMVEDTPCLREKLSFGKGPDTKNTINMKDYAGGFLVILSAGSDANVASRSLRIVIKDEVSKYPITKLGDTAVRIDAMATTFFNSKIINLSTPTIKRQPGADGEPSEAGYCRATERWLASDQRLPYAPCPYCGHFQMLRRTQLKFTRPGNSGNVVDDVWYECENPACFKKKIAPMHQRYMIENGKWVAQAEFRGHAGFASYPVLWSPWVTWEQYANAYLRMWRQIDTRKTFVNEWDGEAWDEMMSVDRDASIYTKRCEIYDKVPLRAAILTGYVDVQADRLECEIKAWGEARESWGMGHRIFYGDVGKLTTGHLPKVWEELFIFLSQSWEHESGAILQLSRVFIDLGYSRQEVLRFCKGKRNMGIWPSQGMSDPRHVLVTRRPVKTQTKDRVIYFPIGPNAGKEIVLANMDLTEEGPGYMHFRKGHYDDEYFKQVVLSERYRWNKGVKVYEKISTSSRNEGLDLCVGNLAAFESLAMDPKPYVLALQRQYEQMQIAKGKGQNGEEQEEEAPVELGMRRMGRRVISKGVI